MILNHYAQGRINTASIGNFMYMSPKWAVYYYSEDTFQSNFAQLLCYLSIASLLQQTQFFLEIMQLNKNNK